MFFAGPSALAGTGFGGCDFVGDGEAVGEAVAGDSAGEVVAAGSLPSWQEVSANENARGTANSASARDRLDISNLRCLRMPSRLFDILDRNGQLWEGAAITGENYCCR
ncbi:hypothetical protein GCM10009526_20680 [Glutamicibacter creatinolyticus]